MGTPWQLSKLRLERASSFHLGCLPLWPPGSRSKGKLSPALTPAIPHLKCTGSVKIVGDTLDSLRHPAPPAERRTLGDQLASLPQSAGSICVQMSPIHCRHMAQHLLSLQLSPRQTHSPYSSLITRPKVSGGTSYFCHSEESSPKNRFRGAPLCSILFSLTYVRPKVSAKTFCHSPVIEIFCSLKSFLKGLFQ